MISDYQTSLKNQVRDHFNRMAPRWDKKNLWNAYYKTKLADFCATLIPEEGSVLEVGCATGELLSKLKCTKPVGLDLSEAMIERAQKKLPHGTFQVADIEHFESDKQYDVVVLSDLVGTLVDVWRALRQLRHLCHSQTRLVFTYHNHWWGPLVRLAGLLGLKIKPPLRNWIRPEELTEVLDLNGFDVVRTGNCILLPIYIPLLSNFVNRFIAPLPFIRHLCFTRFLIARSRDKIDTTHTKSVTVLVPCLNEAGNIAPLEKRLPQFGSWMEILFVDGGSNDGTVEEIEKLIKKSTKKRKFRFLKQTGPKGKGGAVRQGFEAAEGDLLMILDADISVAPEDLPKFYSAYIEGRGEMINGSRLIYSMEQGAMRFFNFIANHFFRISFSWILSQPIRDTLCGTKVLSKIHYNRLAEARHYFGDFDPFGDFDLLFGASRLNLKIINVPVRYEARHYGSTKIHRWSHGWLLFQMCGYAFWKLKFVK